MNKRYYLDLREVPVEEKKKPEIKTTKPLSLEMFLLAVIASIILFPNMWKELTSGDKKWRANSYDINITNENSTGF